MSGCLGAGILFGLLCCAPTAAREPDGGAAAAPATTVRITFFNDSLNLGIGAAAALFGHARMDGDDLGYTHGVELALERLSPSGVTATWALGSRLYIRREPDPAPGEPRERVPILFTEEETLSGVIDTRQQRRPWFYELGGGLVFDNKRFNSLGASGQQQWFHSTFNTGNQTSYRYLDDGRSRWSVFAHAALGLQRSWSLGPAVEAAASARLAARPQTFTAASQLIQECAASLALAGRAARLSVLASVETVLHPEGIAVNPAVGLAYERRSWGLRSAVTFPRGQLRNHVRYNEDHDPIASLSLDLRFGH